MGILIKIDNEVRKKFPELKTAVDSKIVQEIIESIVGEGTKIEFVKSYLKEKGYLYIDIINKEEEDEEDKFDLDAFFESDEFIKEMAFTEKQKDYRDNHELFEKQLSEQSEERKHEIIVANLPLVNKIASKYIGKTNGAMDYEDLVSEGTYGLMKAVDRYNVKLGFEFSTYAYHWIKQAITRSIADKSLSIRLPVHIHETLNKINKIERETWRWEEEIEFEEIARLCEISLEKYKEMKLIEFAFRHSTSINTPLKENGDEDISMMLGRESSIWIKDDADNTDPVQETEKNFLREELEKLLDILTDREENVLRLRFGIDDDKTRTLEEIGLIFGVTRERIRQIEAKALRKLAFSSEKSELAEFIAK